MPNLRMSACAVAWQLLAALAFNEAGSGRLLDADLETSNALKRQNTDGQIDAQILVGGHLLHLVAVHSLCSARSTCRRYRAAMPLIVSRAAYECVCQHSHWTTTLHLSRTRKRRPSLEASLHPVFSFLRRECPTRGLGSDNDQVAGDQKKLPLARATASHG
ncbi:hypothetical protein V8C26DRAFT_19370 [Trichoderma gracile]